MMFGLKSVKASQFEYIQTNTALNLHQWAMGSNLLTVSALMDHMVEFQKFLLQHLNALAVEIDSGCDSPTTLYFADVLF